MKELLNASGESTGLFAISVRGNGYDFSFRRNNQITYLIKGSENPLSGGEKCEIIELPDVRFGIVIKDFEILGEVTADIISFDVEPYLKPSYKKNEPTYYCYSNDEDAFATTDKHKAFHSLLSLNQLLFNQENKEPQMDEYVTWAQWKKAVYYWQSAQSEVVEKLLIIKKL